MAVPDQANVAAAHEGLGVEEVDSAGHVGNAHGGPHDIAAPAHRLLAARRNRSRATNRPVGATPHTEVWLLSPLQVARRCIAELWFDDTSSRRSPGPAWLIADGDAGGRHALGGGAAGNNTGSIAAASMLHSKPDGGHRRIMIKTIGLLSRGWTHGNSSLCIVHAARPRRPGLRLYVQNHRRRKPTSCHQRRDRRHRRAVVRRPGSPKAAGTPGMRPCMPTAPVHRPHQELCRRGEVRRRIRDRPQGDHRSPASPISVPAGRVQLHAHPRRGSA